MKKIVLLLCTLICANVLMAQTRFTINSITYEVIIENLVEIHAYNDSASVYVIPSTVTYQGTSYNVTRIGHSAFYNKTGLTSVIIPNSINIIEHFAFEGCTRLTSVNIPNSVWYIGQDAFLWVKHIIYNGVATGSPWGAFSVYGFVENGFVYTDST